MPHSVFLMRAPDRRFACSSRSNDLEVRPSRLSPLGAETPVGKFVAKRGPGMHHVAFEVTDVKAELDALAAAGVELVDREPRQGLFGLQVAFLHPDAAEGVLCELVSRG